MPVSQTYLRNTKFEDFDPNEPSKSDVVWAVYNGSRFRTFAQRGYALSSFNNDGQAKLYEFVNVQWVERVVKYAAHNEKRPQVCDVCRNSVMEHWLSYDRNLRQSVPDTTKPKRNVGRYEWVRYGGRLVDPLQLVFCCSACQQAVRSA